MAARHITGASAGDLLSTHGWMLGWGLKKVNSGLFVSHIFEFHTIA